MVGRTWELNALTGILDESITGAGSVVGVVGSPGIGKSRIVREVAAIATGRGVDVFTTHCESHTADIPFHAISRLLRATYGVNDIDDAAGREEVRQRFDDADPADIILLDDLLGIRDSTTDLPDISPDARRRRLANLVKSTSLARPATGVYIIEDVHWIDEVSESILADLLTVVPQTPSMVLITYRPEYQGALGRTANAQTIALTPLNDSQASALIAELLGPDGRSRHWVHASRNVRPEIPSSSRRSSAIWPNERSSKVTGVATRAAATSSMPTCRPPCRPPLPLVSTGSTTPPSAL